MLKNSKGERYALSPKEEICLDVSQKRDLITKKKPMITDLQEHMQVHAPVEWEDSLLDPLGIASHTYAEKKEHYDSLLIRATGQGDPWTAVVRHERADMLRISLVNMTLCQCYLFALDLPLDFPLDHILVLGGPRHAYIPDATGAAADLYSYELTVPANTEREEYRQRILNELNAHFELEVRTEMLHIVKGSRPISHLEHEEVEILWDEQLTVIMKTKKGARVGKTYPILAQNN